MHVLVIGGAGYIGSHVVKALLKNNIQVSVYDNLSTGNRINYFPKASYIEADILDIPQLEKAMSNHVDAVIHLAAKKAVGESMEKPEIYALNNTCGAINILNAMVKYGVKNLIFSSSAAVYGIPEYVPMDEKHPIKPISFYGFTKSDMEKYFAWYDQLKGIKYVSLRYFNAVGYDEDGDVKGLDKNPQNLLPILMETAVGKRNKMFIFGKDYETRDGTCIRDYIHVSDLADAHVKAVNYLQQGGESQLINLGTEVGISVLEMVKRCEKLLHRKINFDFAPRRPGDPPVLLASAKKAKDILNWKASQASHIDNIILSTWNVYNLK